MWLVMVVLVVVEVVMVMGVSAALMRWIATGVSVARVLTHQVYDFCVAAVLPRNHLGVSLRLLSPGGEAAGSAGGDPVSCKPPSLPA